MQQLTCILSELHAMGTYVSVSNILHEDVQNNALVRVSHRRILNEPCTPR